MRSVVGTGSMMVVGHGCEGQGVRDLALQASRSGTTLGLHGSTEVAASHLHSCTNCTHTHDAGTGSRTRQQKVHMGCHESLVPRSCHLPLPHHPTSHLLKSSLTLPFKAM